MSDHLLSLWKYAPVVALLILALWAGHRGFWYWGRGARGVIRHIEQERDEWKELARTLLKKYADIDLPTNTPARSISETLKKNGGN